MRQAATKIMAGDGRPEDLTIDLTLLVARLSCESACKQVAADFLTCSKFRGDCMVATIFFMDGRKGVPVTIVWRCMTDCGLYQMCNDIQRWY